MECVRICVRYIRVYTCTCLRCNNISYLNIIDLNLCLQQLAKNMSVNLEHMGLINSSCVKN